MSCIICEKPAGIGSTRLQNGRVCKDCTSKLPSIMLRGRPYLQEYTLKYAMDYVSKNMEKFQATASYGKLHIDEIHGLFAVSDALNKENKPKSGNNIFSVYDLGDVGLCCNSPRFSRGNVFADIEFTCSIENPRVLFKVVIKRNAKCVSKRSGFNDIDWNEPSDLSMFRTLFNNMLSGAFERIANLLCGKTIYEFELEKARALFMLDENYTNDNLKKARRLLMKAYHPDVAGEDVTREAQIINDSYNLLRSHLENQNHI